MAWTTPKTNWATGELVAAGDMNAIGENLAALKQLAKAAYTTTADIRLPGDSAFDDVDSDNLNLTITTSGGDVLAHFHGSTPRGACRLDVEIDGNRHGDTDNGILYADGFSNCRPTLSFTRLIQNLNAGSHTFKLQAKSSQTLRAGAQFWVREI